MTGSSMTGWLRVCLAIAVLVGCGHKNSNNDSDANGGGGDGGIDAPPFSGMCTDNGPQCSNCKDDDGDGRIDGFDPECTGASDDDERTFATGIPGDNKDPVMQDCFFDGNSGAGNDGCNVHTCCLLGAKNAQECPVGANQYDPKDCPPPLGTATISQKCIDTCGKLTPPGCDCFGCCTICDPATNQCFSIVINPAVPTGCTPETLADPTKCLRCTKNTDCGSAPCGGETCILCPGQDPGDLPSTCGGARCPTGSVSCLDDGQCSGGTYCSNGCCIGVIL